MKLVFFSLIYTQNVQRDRVYGHVEILRTNAHPVAIGSKPNGALQFDTCHGGRSAWAGWMPELETTQCIPSCSSCRTRQF